jgi:hypothetical protein
VSFKPLPFYPRIKSPRYLLDRRLGGLQSWSGRYEEDKILDLIGTRRPTDWATAALLKILKTNFILLGNLFESQISYTWVGIKISFYPTQTQCISIIRTNWIIQFSEIIAVHSENHMKLINTLCGQNVEFI